MNSRVSIDLSNERRGREITEYVSAGLACLTGGLSEAVMLPLRGAIERKLRQLEETLVEEMRLGHIGEDLIIEEDRLTAFILRVRRAAIEGTAKNKIRIIARYFFRNAPSEHFDNSSMFDFVSVTEQLTDADMRCLAVLKRAILNAYFERPVDEGVDVFRIDRNMDLNDIFSDQKDFNEAAVALVRFGFVKFGSGWGEGTLSITQRGCDYINNLDLDCIDTVSSHVS